MIKENKYRTHTCNDLTVKNVGDTVSLSGFVSTIRDHGGVMFIDLRDHYGVTQLVVHDNELLNGVVKECVISVKGKVILRDTETVNEKINTGEIEVEVSSLTIEGPVVKALPFEIATSKETKEELRLKYRYLDLRNKEVHDKIVMRSKIISHIRSKMNNLGFLEMQTPILTSSSPEGARDFIIPSRKHHGMFYALPQAPQIFKQLLMISGFDRYFQIAPCFRDEDAKLDRTPGEFYQLDFEMAFATQEDVFAVAEEIMADTFNTFTKYDQKIETPFKRLTYKEAMDNYGSDKPDLRNPLMIKDISDIFAEADFPAFKGKIVKGINVNSCAGQSKGFFEKMLKFATDIGMKGLGYIKVNEDLTFNGPIDKFIPEHLKEEIKKIYNLQADDVLFFIADNKENAPKYAGQIRNELARRLDLVEKNVYRFCFITDYPMYEMDEETGEIAFTHNPFSMPQGELNALIEKDPLDILAYQYDIVCNGIELSSGAVRNHRRDVMEKAFEIAGYTKEVLETQFPALYTAFQYGAPPHAGMAPGIDRIVMLLTEEESIREVIAFPLTSNAQDLMMGAPNTVTEQQLRETHIKIR